MSPSRIGNLMFMDTTEDWYAKRLLFILDLTETKLTDKSVVLHWDAINQEATHAREEKTGPKSDLQDIPLHINHIPYKAEASRGLRCLLQWLSSKEGSVHSAFTLNPCMSESSSQIRIRNLDPNCH